VPGLEPGLGDRLVGVDHSFNPWGVVCPEVIAADLAVILVQGQEQAAWVNVNPTYSTLWRPTSPGQRPYSGTLYPWQPQDFLTAEHPGDTGVGRDAEFGRERSGRPR